MLTVNGTPSAPITPSIVHVLKPLTASGITAARIVPNNRNSKVPTRMIVSGTKKDSSAAVRASASVRKTGTPETHACSCLRRLSISSKTAS